MLSAPVKSAKRISSIFSLGSNRDTNDNDNGNGNGNGNNHIDSAPSFSPHSSPQIPKSSPEHNNNSNDNSNHRQFSNPLIYSNGDDPNSPSVDTRGNGNGNGGGGGGGRRNVTPGSIPDLDLESPLPPPPSLLDINQDLADTANSPDSRPQSRGRRRSSASRPKSSAGLSIPDLPLPIPRPRTPSSNSTAKRRSWMPGFPRSDSVDLKSPTHGSGPSAWIAGLDQKVVYDLDPLARGDQISELWNDQGDTFVYLFPESAGRPPSFKVDSTIFAASPTLTYLARGTDAKVDHLQRHTRGISLGSPTATPAPSSPDPLAEDEGGSTGSGRMMFVDDEFQELHLHLPIPLKGDVSRPQFKASHDDLDAFLAYRNLFAFLVGQSLIATPKCPTLFSIFMDIAGLLTRFEFSNLDGSNFGETATTSLGNYCNELHLDDVRKSREKTIEAIILGERLRYYPLYLEGFVHGVGKFEELKQLRSPKYSLMNPTTQKRLERGYLDLYNRLRVLYSKLEDFDFPSIFSGVANSTSSAESKVVRFKAWRAAFMEFRKFTMHYYGRKYGSWPPKAKSKKNNFEESGLNRLLLKEIYNDFADLYDLLVDRTSLTTRTPDVATDATQPPSSDPIEMTVRALRQLMSEYDRATPPVQPPIPFDVPQIPSLSVLQRKPLDAKKEAKQRTKRLKDSDINAVLMSSYSRDSIHATPFIESFMQFERRSAHKRSLDELIDLRCGQWIFLYAVIQSLPLLVVDASDLKYTDAVEYFLCVAPRGGAPWIQSENKVARSWFGVAGGGGVVSMPSDVVVNGVEGVYRRSHCWQVAEQWAENGLPEIPPIEDNFDNESSMSSSAFPAQQSSTGSSSDPHSGSAASPGGLAVPPAIPRNPSPGASVRAENRYSIHSRLAALPLPAGVAPMEPPARPLSRLNPNMSFDDILKDMPKKGKK